MLDMGKKIIVVGAFGLVKIGRDAVGEHPSLTSAVQTLPTADSSGPAMGPGSSLRSGLPPRL